MCLYIYIYIHIYIYIYICTEIHRYISCLVRNEQDVVLLAKILHLAPRAGSAKVARGLDALWALWVSSLTFAMCDSAEALYILYIYIYIYIYVYI